MMLQSALRNPVVQKVSNQVFNLVNKIIADKSLVSDEERSDGTFEIRIELARSLKNSREKRERISNSNSKNYQINQDALKEIKRYIPHPSVYQAFFQKVRLFCLHPNGHAINQRRYVRGSKYAPRATLT